MSTSSFLHDLMHALLLSMLYSLDFGCGSPCSLSFTDDCE